MPSKGLPRYRLAEGVLSVPVDGEAILLTISSGKYYGVKGAMQHLLEDLREGLALDQMVQKTCVRYKIDEETAAADLERMLAGMTKSGILETVEN